MRRSLHLIAVADRHGDALEREIGRKTHAALADFQRTVNRLQVLAHHIELRLAQLRWLQAFPHGPDVDPIPLVAGQVPVADQLAALP